MLNLSPLFFTTVDDESCMHDELDLSPEQRAWIASARNDVRNCLRTGIPRVLRERGYTDDVPQPRFFTQGSWAYKTLNGPAQRPQQADVDDGCYLPLSFVSQTKRPSRATTVFFAAAEEALRLLVEEKHWKLVTDKPTCIRIVIAAYAHIDIPLYAIPDEEFVTLAKASMERYGYDSLTEAVNMAERDAWTALPADKVLLAHRECNWMPSDPRPVKEWFLGEVEAKGEQFRRVIRYLKAFRDWRWSSGGPASILLMAAAAPLFEKRDRRDDLGVDRLRRADHIQIADLPGGGVDADVRRTRHVGDHTGVGRGEGVVEGLLFGLDRGVLVQHDHLGCAAAVGFQVVGDEARALVRPRRAAVGRLGDRHHEGAVAHAGQLGGEQGGLRAGLPGVGRGGGVIVLGEAVGVHELDARREHEAVVGEAGAVRQRHRFRRGVDGADPRLLDGHAVLGRQAGVGVAQGRDVAGAAQHQVAHDVGGVARVGLDQRDLHAAAAPQAQVLGDGGAGHATANHHHASLEAGVGEGEAGVGAVLEVVVAAVFVGVGKGEAADAAQQARTQCGTGQHHQAAAGRDEIVGHVGLLSLLLEVGDDQIELGAGVALGVGGHDSAAGGLAEELLHLARLSAADLVEAADAPRAVALEAVRREQPALGVGGLGEGGRAAADAGHGIDRFRLTRLVGFVGELAVGGHLHEGRRRHAQAGVFQRGGDQTEQHRGLGFRPVHRTLQQDPTGVDPGVDDEDRRTRDLDSGAQRVARAVHAGEAGHITVATNMAGRGTDIKPPQEMPNIKPQPAKPVKNALRLAGMYSDTMVLMLGMAAPKPTPVMKRKISNCSKFCAKAEAMLQVEKMNTAMMSTVLRPILSATGPKDTAPTAKPNKAALITGAKWLFSKFHSVSRLGAI